MKTKILGVAGLAGSGKDSVCAFLHALYFTNIQNEDGTSLMDYAKLDNSGDILVPVEGSEEPGIIKLWDDNPEFLLWLHTNVSKHIERFDISGPLKRFLRDTFGLNWATLNGTYEEKNLDTPFRYKDTSLKIPKGTSSDTFLTYRQFMQYEGERVRKIYPRSWIAQTFNEIEASGTEFAVVPGLRNNEDLKFTQKYGGKIIGLTRNPYKLEHATETSLDLSLCDYVLNNDDLDMQATHELIFNKLIDWGFLKGSLVS